MEPLASRLRDTPIRRAVSFDLARGCVRMVSFAHVLRPKSPRNLGTSWVDS
eukprot:COSAG02_NODE_1262_length_13556_cov_11.011522_10_plen_51_part_00